MQTIKTGVVVALLMAVCYGAFVALNAPEPELPEELRQWAADAEGLGDMLDIEFAPADSSATLKQLPVSKSNNLPSFSPASNADQAVANFPDEDLALALPKFDKDGQVAAGDAGASAPTVDNETPLQANRDSAAPPPTFPSFPPAALADVPAEKEAGTGALAAPQTDAFQGPDGMAVRVGTGNVKPPAQVVSSKTDVHATNSSADQSWQLPLLEEDAPAAGTPPSAEPTLPTLPFVQARDEALRKARDGKLAAALKQLSPYYNSPELTHTEHTDLVDILDALSREVIYSSRHLLTSAYVVESKETIESVAAKHRIAPELLAKINQIGNSKTLASGSELKVIPGPFRAQLSLVRGELTVFLGEMYAGRFPVALGKDPVPSAGTFEVVDRRKDRVYYGRGGTILTAEDRRNPYGGYWLNLGHEMCIHGTAEAPSADLNDAGCISLAPLDAADVYDILTQGSQVTIVR